MRSCPRTYFTIGSQGIELRPEHQIWTLLHKWTLVYKMEIMMPTSSSPCLSAKNLTRIYKSGANSFTALNNVSLDIFHGEFVAIMGKSGSGKSTLINLLAGLDQATTGTIHAGKQRHEISSLNENQLARWRGKNAGIVFQFFQLLPSLSVLENIMLPMDLCNVHTKSTRKNYALNLLDELGIAEHANKLPRDMSGGQQQRAAIARALANDPDLILADEPTGNLDSATSLLVMDLLAAQTKKGKAVIMVTHDLDLAPYFTRTISLDDGVISNSGAAA